MKYIPLIIIAIFYFNFSTFSQDKVLDQVLSVVGGKVILLSDVESQYHQLKLQGYESAGDAKCEILEELLFQKLLLNQAELDSIEVTPKEVNSAMESRFKYFISQIGSEEKLEEYFGKSLVEMKEDLRDNIKEQLLTQKMQSKITDDIKITPSEVKAYMKEIPVDSIPFINTELEIQQIAMYPIISDDEKLAVKEKLNEFRERILNGDKFSTLAVLYSEDPGSAKKGGELGLVSRSELVPEFAAVAFNIKEGEVSRIVETEFGYHILQLIEKKGELVNVRHILLTPKPSFDLMLNLEKKLDSIAYDIRNGTITFEAASDKYSEDSQSKYNGGLMTNPYTGTSKFETSQIDPTSYYAIKDLDIGEVSKTFQTRDEKGKIVFKFMKVKSKSKPHKANLKDDYQRIQDDALAFKKQNIVNTWVEKKLETTYIHIDESYAKCSFKNKNWVKVQ
ncbi:MAG: hypothetical protein A2046_10720 [Bacteroidetes bacterium GWA2_30_7]|nr:MAG: hypothetical protein A2046_10720 [Bacteroidetes bacterium GWA2_30_7]